MPTKYEVPIKKIAENLNILMYFDPNLQGFDIKDRNNPVIITSRKISDEMCKEVENYWNKIENIQNPPLPFPQFKNPMSDFTDFFKDCGTSTVEAFSIYSNFLKNMKPALRHREISQFAEVLKKAGIVGDKVDVEVFYRGTNIAQRSILDKLYEKNK